MDKIKIHYKSDAIREMYRSAGIKEAGSSGFDLVNVHEEVFIPESRYRLVDLGVVIKIPEGYHAILMPRSSTFQKYRLLQANSIGLIDNSYCGKRDVWKLATYWIGEDGIEVLRPGTRIAQFFLQKIETFEVDTFTPEDKSRGGYGSTGV